MKFVNYFKTLIIAISVWTASLCFFTTIALAGPGGHGGDGQEPWPLAFGSLNNFKKAELIGTWEVENTPWILMVKNVRNQNKLLMAQLWDEQTNESIFNGPLRLEPMWVEGIGMMSEQDFCSIYMFRTKTGFKMKLICNERAFDFNLIRVRKQ